MAELESGFEGDLRDHLLDNAESELVGQQNNLIFRFIQVVHSNLRSYGRRNGYDVEGSTESVEISSVDRGTASVSVTVTWTDPQMGRWEFGIDEHTIRAQEADTLAFVWQDPPGWVREEFDQARGSGGQFQSGWMVFFESVEHPGIPESRAIREALNGLRTLLRD